MSEYYNWWLEKNPDMSLLDKLSTASKSWMVFCYQLTYLELHPLPNPVNLVSCREIVDILRTEQWHIPREKLYKYF